MSEAALRSVQIRLQRRLREQRCQAAWCGAEVRAKGERRRHQRRCSRSRSDSVTHTLPEVVNAGQNGVLEEPMGRLTRSAHVTTSLAGQGHRGNRHASLTNPIEALIDNTHTPHTTQTTTTTTTTAMRLTGCIRPTTYAGGCLPTGTRPDGPPRPRPAAAVREVRVSVQLTLSGTKTQQVPLLDVALHDLLKQIVQRLQGKQSRDHNTTRVSCEQADQTWKHTYQLCTLVNLGSTRLHAAATQTLPRQ